MTDVDKSIQDRLTNIMTWLREPDWTEQASLEWLKDWMDRRPIAELAMVAMLMPDPAATPASDIALATSYLLGRGMEQSSIDAIREYRGETWQDALDEIAALRSPSGSAGAMREALYHAQARFECLAEDFDKAGDITSWAMCNVDAGMMFKALAAPQALEGEPVAWRWRIKDAHGNVSAWSIMADGGKPNITADVLHDCEPLYCSVSRPHRAPE